VPASVAVISQSDIEALGVQRVEDFINLVPGVTLVDAGDVGDTQINIRGINGARDAENSIALVIDGILMTNPAAVNREYTNLQQIEIIKGPQGALYGRNAAAGAFIITTQQPGDEFSASFRGSAAEDASYTLMGNLSGPLGDSLGWSLGADYRTSDGFYENLRCTQAPCSDPNNIASSDDEIDNLESWNIDGRLVWDVTENWTLDSKFRYGEVDASSITFNSVFHLPGFAEFDAAWFENVNDRPFQFNTNITSFNEQEATEFSVRSTTDLGWADLTAWGLYSDIDNNLGADGAAAAFSFFVDEPFCEQSTADNTEFPVRAPQIIGQVPESIFTTPDFSGSIFGAYTPTGCDGTQYQERNQKDFSFEVRLASKSDQRLRWSGGLYYLNIDREVGVNTAIDSGTGIVKSLFVPNNGAPGVNNATDQLIHDQFDSDIYAVFGQIAFDITDGLEAAFALRYDREEREAKSLVPTVADGATAEFITCADPGQPPNAAFTDPINPGLCPDVNPSGVFTPRDETFDEWQPKVSLTWDIFPTVTAYTSLGVGFKSGGFNGQGSAATMDKYINSNALIDPNLDTCDINPTLTTTNFCPVGLTDDYRKETSTSFELGVKSTIGDSIRWEAAYYHVEVDDMQFFEFVVGPFGLMRVIENIDEATMDGFEATVVWSATDWLNVFAGGNWIDSEIDKNTVRPDTVGSESPYTPEWTANLGGDIVVPITPSLNLIGSVDFSGFGDTWFHVVQTKPRPTAFGPGDYTIAQRDAT